MNSECLYGEIFLSLEFYIWRIIEINNALKLIKILLKNFNFFRNANKTTIVNLKKKVCNEETSEFISNLNSWKSWYR